VVRFLPPVELELRPRALLVPDERLVPDDELLLRLRALVPPADAPLAATERFLVPVELFLVVVVVFARLLLRAVELPPLRPPARAGSLFSVFPLPEPDFLPPPSDAFTVAHARRSASFSPTPRFS
jgi:hypothetical protein